MSKFQTWWWFNFRNRVIREGESGGFKWCFRRLTFDISTVSGNFKARFTAAEHPYAYLLAGKDDENIIGFCQIMYTLGMLITTDQKLVDDVTKVILDFEKRRDDSIEVKEDETEEAIALEEVKQVQEYVEAPRKEQKKRERDVNGRFKKAVKEIETAQ